jgi:hypothetical protein
MSGGRFDYAQYHIKTISDGIRSEIDRSGKPLTDEEKYECHDDEWYEKYPEDLFHHRYPDEIIDKFKEAIKYLDIAEVYAQRIDRLLSGDDSEDTFLVRLKEELDKLGG